jgi:hypothetical protein
MNINLPIGLFIIKKSSNIYNINSLTELCKKAHRQVDIITDLYINDIAHPVNQIDKPEKTYDFCFIAGTRDQASSLYVEYSPYLKEKHWFAYMLPVSAPLHAKDILQEKNFLETIGYDAVVLPRVLMPIGGEMLLLYNKEQVLNQMSSENFDMIWGNVFRATGFFNSKVKLIDGNTWSS